MMLIVAMISRDLEAVQFMPEDMEEIPEDVPQYIIDSQLDFALQERLEDVTTSIASTLNPGPPLVVGKQTGGPVAATVLAQGIKIGPPRGIRKTVIDAAAIAPRPSKEPQMRPIPRAQFAGGEQPYRRPFDRDTESDRSGDEPHGELSIGRVLNDSNTSSEDENPMPFSPARDQQEPVVQVPREDRELNRAPPPARDHAEPRKRVPMSHVEPEARVISQRLSIIQEDAEHNPFLHAQSLAPSGSTSRHNIHPHVPREDDTVPQAMTLDQHMSTETPIQPRRTTRQIRKTEKATLLSQSGNHNIAGGKLNRKRKGE